MKIKYMKIEIKRHRAVNGMMIPQLSPEISDCVDSST